MRIAFLTPEFPSEKAAGGGVGNYVLKMGSALRDAGHDPEVFVLSQHAPGMIDYQGIRVHRVSKVRPLLVRAALKVMDSTLGWQSTLLSDILNAKRLALALEARHAQAPFAIVQSSNYHLTGMSVARRSDRCHMVRLSTSRLLYDQVSEDKRVTLSQRLTEKLDVRGMKQADVAYAPSRFLASYFNARYGLDLRVVRPPYELSFKPLDELPWELPERFFLHFGRLSSRKGTDLVADALSLAWQQEPAIRMVWAGVQSEAQHQAFQAQWGEHRDKVMWLGPVQSAALYGILKRSLAAVLPSRVDNLPNTVIESLALGIPVIGTDGASIDEMVEPGRNGELVPLGDARALADVMVRTWRQEVPWLGRGFQPPKILTRMRPAVAVEEFLKLSSMRSSPVEHASLQTSETR
jgi:glycosyltransferase involved in cell wall biosynthesis